MARKIKRRQYKDRTLQSIYDGTVETYRSGVRGWVAPGRHGMIREDGSRFRGSSMHGAFWNGFDSVANPLPALAGKRWRRPARYVQGSLAQACYMAGRDCAKTEALAKPRQDG